MKMDVETCHSIQAYNVYMRVEVHSRVLLSGTSNFRSVSRFHRQLKGLIVRVFPCASEFFIVHKDLLLVDQLIIFSNANKDS